MITLWHATGLLSGPHHALPVKAFDLERGMGSVVVRVVLENLHRQVDRARYRARRDANDAHHADRRVWAAIGRC